VFYEVNFDAETRVLLEGIASGALAKGGSGGMEFIPDTALDNSIALIKKVAQKIADEVAPSIDGSYCAIDIAFSIRADGNGTVMIGQDPSVGQFHVTIRRPILKRAGT
jgi:hypothetical protein